MALLIRVRFSQTPEVATLMNVTEDTVDVSDYSRYISLEIVQLLIEPIPKFIGTIFSGSINIQY